MQTLLDPRRPTPKHHCRPVTISSAPPHRAPASLTSTNRTNAFPHISFLIESKSLIDVASLGFVGTSVARLD
ncbi:BZ3501_MvSof-1269-A2-R1_Chr6-1g08076 [Microbotryum saponariae]|nr:BZ3501_MvSof-1269-A2-R1_Chr6-1g08076 [Microbotryum saponariae]